MYKTNDGIVVDASAKKTGRTFCFWGKGTGRYRNGSKVMETCKGTGATGWPHREWGAGCWCPERPT